MTETHTKLPDRPKRRLRWLGRVPRLSWKALSGIAGLAALIITGILVPLKVIPGGSASLKPARLLDAGTARIFQTIELDRPRGATITTEGILDFRSGRGTFTTARAEGIVEYLLFQPLLFIRDRRTRKWTQHDLSGLGSGFLFGALSSFSPDPADIVRNIRGSGEVKKVGDDVIFGVDAHHFRGVIDFRKAAQRAPSSKIRRDLLALLHEAKQHVFRVDLWTREDSDSIYKIHARAPLTTDKKGVVLGTIDILFSDFGLPVDIKPPPESQITPT